MARIANFYKKAGFMQLICTRVYLLKENIANGGGRSCRLVDTDKVTISFTNNQFF